MEAEEKVDALLVHDEVFHSGGDAVLRLAETQGLDVLILHRAAEGLVKPQGFRQLSQHRQALAGRNKGREAVYQ